MGIAICTSLILFAQDAGAGQAGAGGGSMMTQVFTLWLPILALFYFFLILPQRREQKKRREMLAALKKNDRVVTAGGVYGVVTNVHLEADEVTLKVDESTNTKLRVTLGSIARVLGEEKSGDTPTK